MSQTLDKFFTKRTQLKEKEDGTAGEEVRAGLGSMNQIIPVTLGPAERTGGAGGESQTIPETLGPVGGGASSERPAKRRRVEPQRVNAAWSDLSEDEKNAYLKPEELPTELKPQPLSSHDIALAINERLQDGEKFAFLTDHFKPGDTYEFYPVLQGVNRKPQKDWLSRFPFLAFSHIEHGFYCVACIVFAPDVAGRGGQALGKFTKKAYRRFKDFQEDWGNHCKSNYHKDAALKAEEFVRRMRAGTSVLQDVSAGYSATVKRNRRMLKAIIRTIRFCTKNELALRGHKEDGRFLLNNPGSSEGLFRETLRLMMQCGDADAKLVLDADANATYLSPMVQNELIECLSDCLLRQVVQRISDAPCFSILADETGQHEQEFLSICVRYPSAGKVREDFLGFVPIVDTTGEVVAESILHRLSELGLDLKKMVGQGYDGAANMSGKIKGVQKRISDQYPAAHYFHCVAHKLNLALSDAAATLHICRAIEGVHKISVYFDGSAKRSEVLRRKVDEMLPESKRKKLPQLAPTRWIQRHETLIAFVELLPAVLSALQELDKSERDSAACDLLNGLSSFASIFSILVAQRVAGRLKFLATVLQAKDIDLLSAYGEIDTARRVLEKWTENAAHYEELFTEAKKICDQCAIKDEVLRQWSDEKGSKVLKDYVHEKIYAPYIEALVDGIKQRFGERQKVAFKLQLFHPSKASELSEEKIADVVKLYEDLLPSPSDIDFEVERWKMRCQQDSTPVDILDTAFDPVIASCYPNIATLLQIFYALPVSTATPERSFSTLGRIFTDARASMLPKRVSSLAIISTYKTEADLLDLDEVVDEFDRKSERRMQLR